jgi:hypothetical protein
VRWDVNDTAPGSCRVVDFCINDAELPSSDTSVFVSYLNVTLSDGIPYQAYVIIHEVSASVKHAVAC